VIRNRNFPGILRASALSLLAQLCKQWGWGITRIFPEILDLVEGIYLFEKTEAEVRRGKKKKSKRKIKKKYRLHLFTFSNFSWFGNRSINFYFKSHWGKLFHDCEIYQTNSSYEG
jgi:hypothetical protein